MNLIVLLSAIGLGIQPVLDWRLASEHRQQVLALFHKAADPTTDIEELREGLAECRNLSTKPFVAELNDFESLVNSKEALAGRARAADDKAASLDQRLEGYRGWLRTSAHVLPVKTTWPEDLATFRQTLVSPRSDKLQHFVDVAGKQVGAILADTASGDKRFQDAEAVIDSCESSLRDSDSEAREAFKELRDRVANARFDAAHDSLKTRVGAMVSKEPKDYLGAVREIDHFLRRKWTEGQEQTVTKYRADTIQSFWSSTKDRCDRAAEELKFRDQDRWLEDFAEVSEPNPCRTAADEYRKELPNQRVFIAAVLGEKQAEGGQLDEAVKTLESVRVWLDRAKQETRQRWYKAAVAARQRKGEWSAAVALLSRPDLEAENWARDLRDRAWKEWADTLAGEVKLLASQEKTDEARRMVAEFVNSDTRSCPPEHVRKVKDVADAAIPVADLAKALAAVTEQEKQQKWREALEPLFGARSAAARVASPERRDEWWQRVIALQQKAGHHPEAVQWLTALQQDSEFAGRVNVPSGKVAEIWRNYETTIAQQFKSVANDKRREAWGLLRKAVEEPQADQTFRQFIGDYAREQMDAELQRVEATLVQMWGQNDWPGARRALDRLAEDLGPWSLDPNGQFAKGRAALDKRTNEAELQAKIDAIKATGNDLPKNVHRKIEDLRKEPLAKHLSDKQAGELTSLQDKNLTDWEDRVYHQARDAAGQKDFEKLGEVADEYTADNCPFSRQRKPGRVEALSKVKRWLRSFDEFKTYEIKAIRSGPWWYSWRWAYDPAVRVRIGEGNSIKDVIAQQDNVKDESVMESFQTNRQFEWKKGVPIEIGVWDDTVENRGHFFGALKPKGSYPLLQLAFTKSALSTDESNYPGSAFKNLWVQLEVSNLEPCPNLPP